MARLTQFFKENGRNGEYFSALGALVDIIPFIFNASAATAQLGGKYLFFTKVMICGLPTLIATSISGDWRETVVHRLPGMVAALMMEGLLENVMTEFIGTPPTNAVLASALVTGAIFQGIKMYAESLEM